MAPFLAPHGHRRGSMLDWSGCNRYGGCGRRLHHRRRFHCFASDPATLGGGWQPSPSDPGRRGQPLITVSLPPGAGGVTRRRTRVCRISSATHSPRASQRSAVCSADALGPTAFRSSQCSSSKRRQICSGIRRRLTASRIGSRKLPGRTHPFFPVSCLPANGQACRSTSRPASDPQER